MRKLLWLLMGCLAVSAPVAAHAADAYPSGQFHFILPNAAGGAAEATARVLADKFTAMTGQSVVVEPKPGADGNLAAVYVAKSKPDGYTILFSFSSTHSINANIYKEMQYDPIKDFAPVTMFHTSPHILYVNSKLPFQNVAELVAYAKANPGKLAFGNAGRTDPSNFDIILLNNLAGINIRSIPYKGAADAGLDASTGRVDGAFMSAGTGGQFADAGKLRALGLTYNHRVSEFPNLPAISETIPGFDMTVWTGLSVPAATPKDRIATLNGIMRKILADPDMEKKLQLYGMDAVSSTPEEFGAFIVSETAKIGGIVKAAGIQPQ